MKPGRTGATGGRRFSVKATDCPRIPAEFLKEEERTMGDRWYKQEYMCEFVDVIAKVFDMDMVMAAFTDKVKPLEL